MLIAEKSSQKMTTEYRIASEICVKLKKASTVLPSDDPKHKNAVMYSISKPLFNYIVNEHVYKKNLSRNTENIVKAFITEILTPLN